MIWKNVSANAQVSSAAGKSEQIKTHQRSFYAPNLKEHSIPAKHHTSAPLQNNRTPISLVKTGYRLLGHLPGLPWDQPQFRAPPDFPLGGPTPPQSMMQCPRRPIGPHPQQSTPLFKWIHRLSQKPIHVIRTGPSTGD
ncbi:hypothetical protein M9H77_30849 [Catharanthus roseus]|uniref:Uncharacterized protein n=1 Tax=Catharanthus roseus TaxID=4058 RepID=A0ACB9ZZQ3_CATRO|nr:hypothetical protein M9H77_30849 [Catharanthus roseus]